MLIEIKELQKRINEEYSFTIKSGEVEIRISKAYVLIVKDESFELNGNGFEIIVSERDNQIKHKQYKRFSKIIEILQEYNAINDNFVEIYLINGCFKSFEEAEEKKRFDDTDMKGLLEKYADCDCFSLTAFFSDSYLSEQERFEIFEKIKQTHKKNLLTAYDNVKDEIQKPFDLLYEEISLECAEYGKKRKENNGFFNYSFICDVVGKETKYSEPFNFFWHMYHTLGMELDLKDNLEKYADMSKKDLFNDLRTEENEVLYENLIKKEIGFSNHCTETGSLLLTYYFKLNNQTKAWLSQFKTDYDLNGLEDLAFYKNGKIMFSSCTHERFHTDLSKK